MASVVSEGGFNSGRLYRADGQKVYYWQLDDGWLLFKDVSRMVHGWIKRDGPADVLAAPVVESWLMRKYDRYEFENWIEGKSDSKFEVPAGYDFGPILKI